MSAVEIDRLFFDNACHFSPNLPSTKFFVIEGLPSIVSNPTKMFKKYMIFDFLRFVSNKTSVFQFLPPKFFFVKGIKGDNL